MIFHFKRAIRHAGEVMSVLMENVNAEMVLGVFMGINVSTELANVEIMKNVELTNHIAMLLQENVVCT